MVKKNIKNFINLLVNKYFNFRIYSCKVKFAYKVNIFLIESGLEYKYNIKTL